MVARAGMAEADGMNVGIFFGREHVWSEVRGDQMGQTPVAKHYRCKDGMPMLGGHNNSYIFVKAWVDVSPLV
jgi:hypothetical protein